MMDPDRDLLRRFVQEGDEAAFRDLIQSRLPFVYGVALRRVFGDTHLAAEVAQSVFVDLARHRRRLAGRSEISSWLYTSTRFAAAKALRARGRHQQHLHEFHAMQESNPPGDSTRSDWESLRPLLDQAMDQLAPRDRQVLILRFFDGHKLKEIGRAIGLTENAANMRLSRALARLRQRLERLGITSTAGALVAALEAQPVPTIPVDLASFVARSALATTSAAGVNLIPLLMSTSSAKPIAISGAVLLALVAGFGTARRIHRETEDTGQAEIARLEAENAALTRENDRLQALANAPKPAASIPAESGSVSPEAVADLVQEAVDHEKIAVNLNRLYHYREDFAEEMGRPPESLNELVEWIDDMSELALAPVAGEDYKETDYSAPYLSVRLPDGEWVLQTNSGVPGLNNVTHDAFEAYLNAQDGQLPATAAELQPYFADPVNGEHYVSSRVTQDGIQAATAAYREAFGAEPPSDPIEHFRAILPYAPNSETRDQITGIIADISARPSPSP